MALQQPLGRAAYLHPSGNPGYREFAGWIPGDEVSAAVLVNDEATDLEGLLKRLLAAAQET